MCEWEKAEQNQVQDDDGFDFDACGFQTKNFHLNHDIRIIKNGAYILQNTKMLQSRFDGASIVFTLIKIKLINGKHNSASVNVEKEYDQISIEYRKGLKVIFR